MRLTDVNTRRLSGLKYKLVCHFKLATDMVENGIREFVYHMYVSVLSLSIVSEKRCMHGVK